MGRNTTKPTLSRKKKKSKAVDFAQIQDIRDQEKEAHLRAKNTTISYGGHYKRGLRFLAELTSSLRQTMQTPGKTQPLWRLEHDFDINKFENAFQGRPNKYSAIALESYLVEKCLNQGLGTSTAGGIHAAFKRYWGDMCAYTL
jgi:hypothetical protein